MHLPMDQNRALAAVIRCHLFHCAYHPITVEEADAVSAISLIGNETTLEKNAHLRTLWHADREVNTQCSSVHKKERHKADSNVPLK